MVPEIKRTRCAYLTGPGRVSKMKCVNRLASPQLRDPVLVAGWPGMGLVAFRAVSFMLEKLETRPLAEFDSREIYPLKNVDINEGLIETSRLPESPAARVASRAMTAPHSRCILPACSLVSVSLFSITPQVIRATADRHTTTRRIFRREGESRVIAECLGIVPFRCLSTDFPGRQGMNGP